MMKVAFFNNGAPWMRGGHVIDVVYGKGRRKRLAELADLYPEIITSENFDKQVGQLQDLDAIFSTWGMVPLTEEQVKKLPELKALFYAAGATDFFRGPFEAQGVKIFSATIPQAIHVAEFALAQVLLAGAGYFRNSRECTNSQTASVANNHRGPGNYENRVTIIGNGAISKKLQEYLSQHNLEIVIVPSRKQNRTISLEEAVRSSVAVVNLLPDRDDNAGVFNGALFSSMMDSAVFINVGRGRQVNEPEMIQVLKARTDLTALLDVQWPEPPVDGSELYTLPNIKLSGHIAGSKGSELVCLSTAMIEEFQRFEKGEPLLYEVQPGQL